MPPTTPTARHPQSRPGFSLIEVNMAILIVAGGLLSLFALFPAGLRMSMSAIADTRQSMFAEDVLSSLRGKASTLSLDYWMSSPENFWNEIKVGTPVAGANPPTTSETDTLLVDGVDLAYFSGGDTDLDSVPARYKIRLHRLRGSDTLDQNLDWKTWRITLVASDQPMIEFDENPMYHLEIRYTGVP